MLRCIIFAGLCGEGGSVVCLHLCEHQRDAFTLDFLSPIARAVYFLRPFLLMFVCAPSGISQNMQPPPPPRSITWQFGARAICWCWDMTRNLLPRRVRQPSTFNSTHSERRSSGALLLFCCRSLSLPPQRQGRRVKSCRVLDHALSQICMLGCGCGMSKLFGRDLVWFCTIIVLTVHWRWLENSFENCFEIQNCIKITPLFLFSTINKSSKLHTCKFLTSKILLGGFLSTKALLFMFFAAIEVLLTILEGC